VSDSDVKAARLRRYTSMLLAAVIEVRLDSNQVSTAQLRCRHRSHSTNELEDAIANFPTQRGDR
jgi:hypothetical protein